MQRDPRAFLWDVFGPFGKSATKSVGLRFSSRGVTAAQAALAAGAVKVYAMVTHGVLAPGSIERIEASPLEKLLITDTIETQPVTLSERIEVVSVAPLLAEAVRRIHTRESISGMFPE